ncbi:MAG: protein translocase subunit SecF, partial [bacterium]|nr:protein translocase subunit SecF [bacterium]
MEKIFFYPRAILAIFGVVVAIALLVLLLVGLSPGIEFTGGSILEVQYEENRPSLGEVRSQLAELGGETVVQKAGEDSLVIRTTALGEETRERTLALLGEEAQEMRFESIGPVIGQELRGQALQISILAILTIFLYIAFAFRSTSSVLMPWHYSGVSLIALFHDMAVLLGFLSIAGLLWGVHVTVPIVVAFLIVFGYSINNTVVVFDRVRENILRDRGDDFL